MNPSHNSSRFKGTCYETSFHPATNIVDKETIEIENVVTSPSLQKTDQQHFLVLPINAGPLKKEAAPNMEGSLSQRFDRLHQRFIFNFLTGHGEVERLPCSEISDNQELYGLSRTTSSLEKIHQEAIQGPDQKSIFKFLNGDGFQCLIFLVDFHLGINSGSYTCGDLSKCLSQLNLGNFPDGNACLDETSHSMQDNGPCSIVSHKIQLTDHHALEHLTNDPTVKMNGFAEVIDGNIHSECSFLTANPFFDSPLHCYQKRSNGVKVSDIVVELGSQSEANQNYLIENLSGMLSKSNCDAEIFEQTTTTYQENVPDFRQHPTYENSVESTFAIPDPEELLGNLHGPLSSPKFLESDLLNGESDNFHFSSNFGNRSSDEVAKSNNLSDSITNPSGESLRIYKEYGILDTPRYGIGSEIGTMTGAFGEIESPDLSSLPNPSQIERIRFNWSSRDVDFSHFDFDDHEDLLELFGLNKQDVQTNDDKFCDSPTWSGKRLIQKSELENMVLINATIKETDSTSEIAGTITAGNRTENCSSPYMDSSSDYSCEIVSRAHEERHESSASRICYHQSFDNVSDTDGSPENYKNAGYQHGNTASLNACCTSAHSFGYFQEHPAFGRDEELKFKIPDTDELMEFLHGSLRSPKFLASDPPNGESDNYHLPSNLGNRSSHEVAKSDNLSDFIANVLSKYGENVNEDGVLGLFGLAKEYEIGAMTGAFGETETPDIPSLPEPSQAEKIRWNWANRNVDSSCFEFGDHEELLELYGLYERDVQVNDDEFCDSPTWPGKQ